MLVSGRLRPSPPLIRLTRFISLVARRFLMDRCASIAQALSYTTLLGLVPLSVVAFAAFSIFPGFGVWLNTVQTFIYAHFVAASGRIVERYLLTFAAKAAQLTTAGLLFLVITALMLMGTIEQAFNAIWRVSAKRRLLHRFLAYWAILTLGPILIGVSLSLSSYVMSLPLFASHPLLTGARRLLFIGLPFILETLIFWLLYVAVPNVHVRRRDGLVGALVATVLFEVAKRVFVVFVLDYSSYRAVYGAVAALPVFLLWIYVSWLVVLVGAVVVATLPEWKALSAGPTDRAP